MQRLEVSGAVRTLYGSLDVKGLSGLYGAQKKTLRADHAHLSVRTSVRP